jgi:epsilon-lactone hydrolase
VQPVRDLQAWRLPAIRPGSPSSESLRLLRQSLQVLEPLQPVAAGVSSHEGAIAGCRCLRVGSADNRRTVIYVHGGGFRLGYPSVWRGIASRLAAGASLSVVVPEYSLAPEKPFPAALHDLAAIYDAVQAEAGDELILVGDSAGGGLACSLLIAARESGRKLPAGLILLSPWVDLRNQSATYASKAASDAAFSQAAAEECAQTYLQGIEREQPLVSPLLGDLSDFPPVLLFASESEVLLGDAMSLTDRLRHADVSVESRFVDGLPHVWPILDPSNSQSDLTIAAMIRFINERLG